MDKTKLINVIWYCVNFGAKAALRALTRAVDVRGKAARLCGVIEAPYASSLSDALNQAVVGKALAFLLGVVVYLHGRIRFTRSTANQRASEAHRIAHGAWVLHYELVDRSHHREIDVADMGYQAAENSTVLHLQRNARQRQLRVRHLSLRAGALPYTCSCRPVYAVSTVRFIRGRHKAAARRSWVASSDTRVPAVQDTALKPQFLPL